MLNVGDCVVVMRDGPRGWVIGRVCRVGTWAEAVPGVPTDGEEDVRCYEVECAAWHPCRRWVEAAAVRPVVWLLNLGQAAQILAMTARWAHGDDLGWRAFCDALGLVIKMGLEGVDGRISD